MRFAKQFLIALAAVVGLLILIGLVLPSSVHVERSIRVNAAPVQVFPMLDDLRMFNRWSPWARIDPETRYTFSDPSSGKGAQMQWDSEHPNVGKGLMRIVESIPNKRVGMILDFGPKGSASVGLRVEAAEQGSRVTWAFDQDFGGNLIGRYFGLMLDGLIGPEYEKGLNTLQNLMQDG